LNRGGRRLLAKQVQMMFAPVTLTHDRCLRVGFIRRI
jgi:hypothetical protein